MPIHPTHKTRFSDASSFDEICVNCGATDEVPGGIGSLAHPCPEVEPKTSSEAIRTLAEKIGMPVEKFVNRTLNRLREK